MNDELLRTYLRDHLTGAEAALLLARRCRKQNSGTPLGDYLAEFVAELKEDKRALEAVLATLPGGPSLLQKGAGKLAAQAPRVKFVREQLRDADLSRLEQIESLVVGVRGKQALWEVLHQIDNGRWPHIEFDTYMVRAQKQLALLDNHRLAAARSAFLGSEAAQPVVAA